MKRASSVLIFVLVLACLAGTQNGWADESRKGAEPLMKATFAGGCFWCMEPPFEKLKGVVSVISGYTGGTEKNPTYEGVSSGKTGHAESVQILFDPKQVSFEQLLDVFWRNINPTQAKGQFVDIGTQYRSGIFYHNSEQKKLTEKSKQDLEKSGRFAKPLVTEIVPVSTFYPAEDYHQDFYKKSPERYHQYRVGSGRDQFIQKTWGNQEPSQKKESVMPDKSEIKKRLTPLQFHVTQEGGTEPPFKNEYWDNHKPGIYVDVVSGEPLFASTDKFDSGTGWPSFTKPLESSNLIDKEDRGLGMDRTEVKSKQANSHLGHVFPDGPAPTGLRYCINSAALRFVPVEDLEKQDYSQYRQLFK